MAATVPTQWREAEPMGVPVILFDAAGTLFHLPRGVGWHYAEVARRHGAEVDPAALDHAFRAAWKAAVPPPETRAPRPDDDRAWWFALADQVFAACGAPGVVERCFEDLWHEFARDGVWELFPETRAVLATLAARHRLGVVSNFDGRLRTILGGLGVASFFEHVIVSSEAGAEKPSPHIFELALARFGVPAAQVWHIGDEPEADWQGAAAAGLRAFPLRRPATSLRDFLPLVSESAGP